MGTTQAEWDYRWLTQAETVAQWSRDTSTKVGCVIVGQRNEILTAGYNGFPRGVNDQMLYRYERPAKYLWTEHAERNAIYNAAMSAGTSLYGGTAYITPLYPCADCARGIIQCGIVAVVHNANNVLGPDPKWAEHFEVAQQMFEEAGVAVRSGLVQRLGPSCEAEVQ